MSDGPSGMRSPRGRILFLEENGVLAENVIECLNNHQFLCRHLEDTDNPLTEDDFSGVDAVLMGMSEDGMAMLDRLENVQRLSGGKPVVVLSSIGRSPSTNDVLAAGARGMVRKPFKTQELIDVLESSMRKMG